MTFTFSDELYSDLFKDAHGYRPSSEDRLQWEESTPEQKQVRWHTMLALLQDSAAEQLKGENRAAARFEEKVKGVMAEHGLTRELAIRRLFQAENDDYVFSDPDYYCHIHRLPYGYFRDVKLVD